MSRVKVGQEVSSASRSAWEVQHTSCREVWVSRTWMVLSAPVDPGGRAFQLGCVLAWARANRVRAQGSDPSGGDRPPLAHMRVHRKVTMTRIQLSGSRLVGRASPCPGCVAFGAVMSTSAGGGPARGADRPSDFRYLGATRGGVRQGPGVACDVAGSKCVRSFRTSVQWRCRMVSQGTLQPPCHIALRHSCHSVNRQGLCLPFWQCPGYFATRGGYCATFVPNEISGT